MGREGAGRLHPEAGRHACDEHALSAEILAREQVICGGRRSERSGHSKSPSSMDAPLPAADSVFLYRRDGAKYHWGAGYHQQALLSDDGWRYHGRERAWPRFDVPIRLPRIVDASTEAVAANSARSWLSAPSGQLRWIVGARQAAHSWGIRSGANSGQEAYLAGLNLQAEVLGVNSALSETAGDETEALLSGARKHVAQLPFIAESPDRANACANIIAKQFANQIFLAFVAGRQHDQIGGKRFTGAHPRSLCDERGDIGKLH